MWPKALTQLIELAPHMVRLLPVADRFLQSKSAEAEASRTAMEQMAEGLRGDLGQVTASHAGLYRQLNEQSERLSTLSAETRATRLAVDATQARAAVIEVRLRRLFYMMTVLAGAMGVALLLLVYVMYLMARHR
jgi:phage-related tail protein